MIYKGVYLCVKCKNRCFEKLIDEAIAKHTVNGIGPKIRFSWAIGTSSVDIYEWSTRLQRHSRRTKGKYISKRWVYCPFCGEKL